MRLVPPNIARCMSPEDRAKYVPGEAIGSEAQEQGKFARALKEWQAAGKLRYNWDSTAKKRTGCVGWPDFTVVLPGPKTLFFELKSAQGELSPPQRVMMAFLKENRHRVFLVRSGAEAIRRVALELAIV